MTAFDSTSIKRRWRAVLGWAGVGAGALLLVLGWFGVSAQTLVAKQLPYLISGGVGGIAFLGAGVGLLIAEDLRADRERLGRLELQILELRDLVRALVDARDTRVS